MSGMYHDMFKTIPEKISSLDPFGRYILGDKKIKILLSYPGLT